MDKEKRIAELEERKRQIDVEIAFEKGSKIEHQAKSGRNEYWYDSEPPNFKWKDFNYRIKEEPRRIPFDGSNAFSLMNKIFRTKNDHSNLRVGVGTDDYNVMFHDMNVDFVELEKYWEKYNTLTETFEPCNKVA